MSERERPPDPGDVASWHSYIGPPYPADVTEALLSMADRAVELHPGAAVLWVARGDLIQLQSEPAARWPLAEVERSYARAIEAEPENAIGYEELGIWLDIASGPENLVGASADQSPNDRRDEAARLLDEALLRGAGPHAFSARARIFAETGEAERGLALLRDCPFADHEAVITMIEEIARGDWNPE